MGFRFRKSVKILPGVKLNISSRGISSTIGGRGASVNVSKRGVRGTVGIPGSGISYSEMIVRNGKKPRNRSNSQAPIPAPSAPGAAGSRGFPWGWIAFIVFMIFVFAR